VDRRIIMKKIAPIIITAICSSYLLFVLIGVFTVYTEDDSVLLLVIAFVILSLIIALTYNLIRRLIEIDKENEDDISKY
jgi:hypothetical protein